MVIAETLLQTTCDCVMSIYQVDYRTSHNNFKKIPTKMYHKLEQGLLVKLVLCRRRQGVQCCDWRYDVVINYFFACSSLLLHGL